MTVERRTSSNVRERALTFAGTSQGFVTSGDFEKAGFNRVLVRQLVDDGLLVNPAWGAYAETETYASMSHLRDWALIAFKYPEVVFGLQSAAVFHGMTQENPPELHVFSPRAYGDRLRMGSPFPLSVHALVTRSDDNLTVGVASRVVDGVALRVTTPERTMVDLFRFSPLGGRERGCDLVTQEMFLDALRTAASDDTRFDFDELAMQAERLGCYEAISPFVKTSRFQIQSASY